MSEQALDLRRSMRIVRRHKIVVGAVTVLGLAVGVTFTILRPPMRTSEALVVLPPLASRYITTQVVIAGSQPVLAGAIHQLDQPTSLQALQGRVQVKSLSPTIISISADGKTAAQSEDTANAVASSYVDYLGSAKNPSINLQAHVLQPAVNATGTSQYKRLAVYGVLGALTGMVIGSIIALAIGRNPRRLRERDDIADAIGVPVLASIPVARPSDAGHWARLLEDYDPGVVHAWSLRKAMRHLALTDYRGARGGSVAVVSLSSDPKALALGPQLAAFTASLGIPTALVIGPQQDANSTATLSAACTAMSPAASLRSSMLRVAVGEREKASPPPGAALTVVVAVVDGRAPRLANLMGTSATVMGVSAGAATAEQLARVAVAVTGEGREIAGIIVADPDSTDHTTGRLPRSTQPSHRRKPTRITGISTGSRQ